MATTRGILSRTRRSTSPTILALALSLLSPPGEAVDSRTSELEPSDSKEETFRLTYFGAEAGEERFVLPAADAGDSLLVTAQATVTLTGRTFSFTQQLHVGAVDHALGRYTLSAVVNEQTQSIRAIRRGDSLVVMVDAPTGRFRRAYHEPGEVFVLDNLLLNHLALLGARIARREFLPDTVRVVVPQVGALLPATITPLPMEPNGERSVEIGIAGVTEVLHFGADHRLDRVEVPAQGILYQRRIPAGPARAIPPPARGHPASESIPEGSASPARLLYEERTVRFVSGKTDFDGILTLPRGGQRIPYPAVLFVHGSGPLDRDGTVGPNRPFLELAHGLAVYGIASFRYDKRTLIAPETIDRVRVTVDQEVIDDAVAALETLRSQSGIDRKALVIVGHSLGGSLAAAIANRGGSVAGLVILAGSPRPLDLLIRDQLHYLVEQAKARGGSSGEQEEATQGIFAQLDSLRAGTLPDNRIILGMNGFYLRDYRDRDPGTELLAFRGPVLILQGGKDYQVTLTDFELWQQITRDGGKMNATFRILPELGHLFIPIVGEPGPASQMLPGNVDPAVTYEISEFVRNLR